MISTAAKRTSPNSPRWVAVPLRACQVAIETERLRLVAEASATRAVTDLLLASDLMTM